MKNSDFEAALTFFERALKYLELPELQHELRWQRSLDFSTFTESDILRETAWVVLCSGFREQVVRRKFDYISLCFCDWESSKAIVESRDHCRRSALSSFRSERKIGAIIKVAELLTDEGFATFKQRVLQDPIVTLTTLPFIGSVTAFHLAKNLGLEVVKPDRHLVKLTTRFGYTSADQMCRELSEWTGESVSVIDLALWRFMADSRSARHDSQSLQ